MLILSSSHKLVTPLKVPPQLSSADTKNFALAQKLFEVSPFELYYSISSYSIQSNLSKVILFYSELLYLKLSYSRYLIQSNPCHSIRIYPIWRYSHWSYPIRSYLIWSNPCQSCSIRSYPIRSYFSSLDSYWPLVGFWRAQEVVE